MPCMYNDNNRQETSTIANCHSIKELFQFYDYPMVPSQLVRNWEHEHGSELI